MAELEAMGAFAGTPLLVGFLRDGSRCKGDGGDGSRCNGDGGDGRNWRIVVAGGDLICRVF